MIEQLEHPVMADAVIGEQARGSFFTQMSSPEPVASPIATRSPSAS